MTRDISTTNLAEINADSLEEIWLVKIEFDNPLYANTHNIDVTFAGKVYTGMGDFGSITSFRESELLAPDPLQLNLSGMNSKLLMDALDATQYGAPITLYQGFLADGALVDDPIEQWNGWCEFAAIQQGATNTITLTAQHDLADIENADNGRYSDEDQQEKYTGDVGFEFQPKLSKLKLFWAGGAVGALNPRAGGRARPNGKGLK